MKDASRAWQKHLKHSVLGFSLWAPREKALFLHIELFLTDLTPSASALGSQKPFPPSLWGTGAFYLPVPVVIISCCSPTLRWERCSSHSISFPLAAGSLSSGSAPSMLRINETLSGFTPAPPTRYSFPEGMFLLGKNPMRIQRGSLSFLCLLLFPTIPLSPVISCSCSLHCC